MENISPFLLNGAIKIKGLGKFNHIIEKSVEASTRLSKLHQLYEQLPKTSTASDFLKAALSTLDVTYQYDQAALERVPRTGPAVIIANHPFGGIEGMIMAHLLLSVRSDVKIVANQFLSRISEISHLFIDVDPFGGRASIKQNLVSVKAAFRWVEAGDLLVVFPAGEVSHLNLRERVISDPEWKSLIVRIIRRYKTPVIPIRFIGHNSKLFQLAGLVHPRLRTLMLPHEMLNKQKQSVEIQIGKAIAWETLRDMSDEQMLRYLRMQTYLLGSETKQMVLKAEKKCPQQQIAEAQPLQVIKAEIDKLEKDNLLVRSGKLCVYIARVDQIPHILQEIGRLREITFRAVGEGTGRCIDLELFDNYYHHLFIWDEAEEKIAGSYRLGKTDEILDSFGYKGLYSHTLFKYKKKLLKKIRYSLELGRSFVREEYQKNFMPLMLLWKGIGEFVNRHPHYHILFGPVSISNDYAPLSQKILVEFLRNNRFDHSLAHYVKPRKKFKYKGEKQWRKSGFTELTDLDQISNLIASVESDQKGMPVLLKQYLKLGGHLLGFNVDEQFSHVLDGLIVVDLASADQNVLARYMGKEQAHKFLQYHLQSSTSKVPEHGHIMNLSS